MAIYIIKKKYKETKESIKEETERIIRAAANLIRAQMREQSFNNETYPTSDDILKGDWIPPNLQLFLSLIVKSELRQESIGQCIVKAAMPRVAIPPILFGVGISLDHLFGLKWLVNELFCLGFSISYHEVVRYKQAVVASENAEDMIASQTINEDSSTQFIADNANHNIRTLTGNGTFHGMAVMAVTTNKMHHEAKRVALRRPVRLLKNEELIAGKGIPIKTYNYPPNPGLDSIVFKSTAQLMFPFTLPEYLVVEDIWHAADLFLNSDTRRPNWSGYLQDVSTGPHHPKSKLTLLPIINLKPSDECSIYSTLLYIIDLAKKLKIVTHCVTFDQPLWTKAMEIITAKSLKIVCRLGGFHMLISFVGRIGTLMEGSGLEKALHTIYGENTWKQIAKGKEIARGVRAHIVAEAALMIQFQQFIVSGDADDNNGNLENLPEAGQLQQQELKMIQSLYNQIMTKEVQINYIDSLEMKILVELTEAKTQELNSKSRTAKLWIQYIEYVKTMRLFIRAGRTADWNLHLVSVSKMINIFAATGHLNYAKSSRLYLQLMLELPDSNPWLHHKVAVEGMHTVRRSENFGLVYGQIWQ